MKRLALILLLLAGCSDSTTYYPASPALSLNCPTVTGLVWDLSCWDMQDEETVLAVLAVESGGVTAPEITSATLDVDGTVYTVSRVKVYAKDGGWQYLLWFDAQTMQSINAQLAVEWACGESYQSDLAALEFPQTVVTSPCQ